MKFLDNKYTKTYFKIVNRVSTNAYTETHHIIPKSLGGTDDVSNLIKLSAREHFICHLLLPKMLEKNTPQWYKMIKAIMIMKAQNKQQYRYFNSRLFENYRRYFSESQSFSQSGDKNSQAGKVWVSDLKKRECYKVELSMLQFILSDTIIPKRIMDFNKYFTKLNKIPKKELNVKIIEQEACNYYYQFKHGNYSSVREFCRTDCDKSHVYIMRIWKKYIYGFVSIQGKEISSK